MFFFLSFFLPLLSFLCQNAGSSAVRDEGLTCWEIYLEDSIKFHQLGTG